MGRSSPRLDEISLSTAWSRAPSHGRRTVRAPPRADSMTARTIVEGIAKPIPWLPPEREKIAVLIPTSRPAMSTRAPPELPGLMAASVWMKNW